MNNNINEILDEDIFAMIPSYEVALTEDAEFLKKIANGKLVEGVDYDTVHFSKDVIKKNFKSGCLE
jgi:hypothetical protein